MKRSHSWPKHYALVIAVPPDKRYQVSQVSLLKEQLSTPLPIFIYGTDQDFSTQTHDTITQGNLQHNLNVFRLVIHKHNARVHILNRVAWKRILRYEIFQIMFGIDIWDSVLENKIFI